MMEYEDKELSKFGLASLSLGVLNLVAFFVLPALMDAAAMSNGSVQIVAFLIPAIGIFLGVVGVMEWNKKRSSSIVGYY